MQAGSLRHLLTVQAATFTANEIGERVPTWADVASLYGAIRPASAREVAYYQAIRQEITHAIITRYSPAVQPDRRLKLGSRIFNIAGIVNVDERNRELRILAYEQQGGAL